MPKGTPLTLEDQANRQREISTAAVNLFLKNGFHETSMRAIACAAGMGKSSLYDYFQTKEDILVFVIEEETGYLAEKAQEIARQDLASEERLRQIMEMHLGYMLANKSLLARLSIESQRLNSERQKRIQLKRYQYQDLVASVIREGIAQGCFRPVNPLLAARFLVNSLLSVLYTTRPTGSPEQMLEESVDIFLKGIKR
jgi:AcrR family transcriptional regulator